jgi:NodT family efflux transporter outer membrane factor (OMF) lipoprotein
VRQSLILGLCTTAALALAGCEVGPNYRLPPSPEPVGAGFVSATPAIAAPTAQPATEWWRLYQDPALDGLVQQALEHNTDLQTAAANLAQARALLNQARAGLFPSTSEAFGGNFGRSALGDYEASTQGRRQPDVWDYDAALDVSYEIDLFGQVRRSIEAAKADAQAAAAAENLVRVTVAAETARAYADACAFHEQADVARQSVQIEQQTFDIALRQRAAGASSDLDVARAATLLDQTRAQIPTLEGQRRAALFQLAVLTGRPPQQISQEADACKTPPGLGQPIPVGDGAALLRRRPDVQRAERQLAAATAGIGVAVANLFPQVTLGASSTAGAPTLGGLGQYKNITLSAGPLITWSFPNLAVAAAQTASAKASASAALSTYNGVVLNALQETETALTTYGGELDRHGALASARDNANNALRLAKVQFDAGSASFLDLLLAQRTEADAQSALAQSDQALIADQITVFKALGGGWENAPAVQPAKAG